MATTSAGVFQPGANGHLQLSETLCVTGPCALEGPGTFRRMSFREPPTDAPTNLFMRSGSAEFNSDGAAVAHRCRVVRPSAELWVMELDLVDPHKGGGVTRRWLRVQPRSLLAACTARLGRSIVTSAGPIVPALRFEGLTRN